MQTTQSISCKTYVPWLTGKASNVYTQFGEDGLIEAVFDEIGTTNRHCFEIGAHDGVWYSNTLVLRELGWSAVLFEADPEHYAKLDESFGAVSKCVLGKITDLDAALFFTSIERTPDFGVIDIDGQDFWMWSDLYLYRPRVMLVETHQERCEPVPERGGAGQAGLDAITALGGQKGYVLVASTYCNALFVDSKCL